MKIGAFLILIGQRANFIHWRGINPLDKVIHSSCNRALTFNFVYISNLIFILLPVVAVLERLFDVFFVLPVRQAEQETPLRRPDSLQIPQDPNLLRVSPKVSRYSASKLPQPEPAHDSESDSDATPTSTIRKPLRSGNQLLLLVHLSPSQVISNLLQVSKFNTKTFGEFQLLNFEAFCHTISELRVAWTYFYLE